MKKLTGLTVFQMSNKGVFSSVWPFQLICSRTFIVDIAGNKNKIMT